MRKYRRMTYEDRCHISALLQADYSINEISKVLEFHRSTIFREISRNKCGSGYKANEALIKAAKRYRRCRRKKIITSEVADLILAYSEFGWSAEQVSGRIKKELKISISYQTIYRKFHKDTLDGRKIRQRKRRRGGGRQAQINGSGKNKVMINKRPKIVEQRKRIGDWERDGMYGANRKQLLVFTDRKSKYTKIKKMGTGLSKDVTNITLETLSALNKKVFTLTNDNGTEFNDSASLPFKVYHCQPHKPQQRGTVENTIGLLRQYIKRKTDLEAITQTQLQDIENKINFRPRKGLDYRTPFEVFFNKKVALVM